MITRSVPLYREVQDLSVNIAKKFLKENSRVYDLGCSTGTTLVSLARALAPKGAVLIGVDSSEPMLAQCRTKIAKEHLQEQIELLCRDILDMPLVDAALVILNYTLQFIDVARRQELLTQIFNALLPDGVLIMTEKISNGDEVMDKLLIELHHDFKEAMGYSRLEIAQKREALEGILTPLTISENIAMLKAAGFSHIAVPLRLYNFATIVAIKGLTANVSIAK